MMNENAKCPFCKSISFDVLTVQKRGNSNIRYQAYCQTCGATGPTSSDKEIAMLAWESPSLESALRQRAEKLESALREAIKAMANSAYKAEILFIQTGIVRFSEIEIALKAEIAKSKEALND
jgi:Flp pilus assembly protein CpaB